MLADWIGSDQEWFPYREQADFKDLETYWDYAQEQANRAIAKAGVVPAGIRDCIDYDALIGAQTTPSPMQEWARTAELPAGPALFMIEDETGSGKTEAALMLAHRLMAAHRAEGPLHRPAHHGHGQRHVRSPLRRALQAVRRG